MADWIPGGYDGVEYLGKQRTGEYRGYVVQVDETGNWFAYCYDRTTDTHSWVCEGPKEGVKNVLANVANWPDKQTGEGGKAVTHQEDKRYRVATHSYACTAYVRTTLRRALALQPQENVWHGTEYVNTARGMAGVLGWSEILPDEQTWELTKLELMTIHRALEWRRGKRKAGKVDQKIRPEIVAEWANIENEIARVLREVWHSEGKYWM